MMEIDQCFAWKKENDRNNPPLLPKDIRGLIVGKSNCGKTTLILNLLLMIISLCLGGVFIKENM